MKRWESLWATSHAFAVGRYCLVRGWMRLEISLQWDSQMQSNTMAVYWVGLVPVVSEILPNPFGHHSEDIGHVTGAPACPGRSVVVALLCN